MKKRAQFVSDNAFYSPETSGKTIRDLYVAVRADAGLDPSARQELLNKIGQLTQGMPASTPLSALMYTALGSMFGYLISKYFGMGAMGQLASTLFGAGMGRLMHKKPYDPYRT